jgi:hypothetical protein
MKELDQLGRGRIVIRLVGPGVARVQDRAVDSGDGDRDLESEILVEAELDVVQRPIQGGVNSDSIHLAVAFAGLPRRG